MIHILQKRSRAAAENKTPGCYRKQENEIVEDQQCSDASHLRAPPAKIFEMGAECGIQAPPSSQLSSFSSHFSNIFACRCTSASSTLCRNFRGDIVEMWFNSPSNECGCFLKEAHSLAAQILKIRRAEESYSSLTAKLAPALVEEQLHSWQKFRG